MNEISMRLLDTIKERQMSYSELAEKTGIAKSAIQRYATGETKKIPLPRLELLANALHVSAAYLMGWTDDSSIVARAHETAGDDENDEFTRLYSSLSDQNKQRILDLMRALEEGQA